MILLKVCLSSSGNSMDSALDPRFGRAAYFVIADTETMDYDIYYLFENIVFT